MKSYKHIPVLLAEVLNFIPKEAKQICDLTLGGGGHAERMLNTCPNASLTGVDKDKDALKFAGKKLKDYGERVKLISGSFSSALDGFIDDSVHFDFVLADLGVSSFQLEAADRGFSFVNKGPLDMRMNQNGGISAYEVINEFSEKKLVELIYQLGEERFARRIVRFIIEARTKQPIRETTDLTQIILAAIPKKFQKGKIHPATKTFQAIRILVNEELEELKNLIGKLLEVLKPGGRGAVISFHSLEDRIVKKAFLNWEKPCQCPPHIPKCICGLKPKAIRLHKKVIIATDEEKQVNPRSRSARLRVIEKL
ncbi:MAG: 16S rRNA (cytosine(1402)-N(4))-methyltransferase RsmH [Deltaproteobacteria bacterium]|nr:16S rRNA (cytosine(1402)-N(4))-methyltransferase RsmH [Deltaproteobacteria bacterium]